MATGMTVLILASGRSSRMGRYCKKINKCLLKVHGTTLLSQLISHTPFQNVSVVLRPDASILKHYISSMPTHINYLVDTSGDLDYMGTLNSIHDHWKSGAWVLSSDIWVPHPLELSTSQTPEHITLYVHDPSGHLTDHQAYPLHHLGDDRGLTLNTGQSFTYTGIGYLKGPLWPVNTKTTLSSYLSFLLTQGYPIDLLRAPWPVINMNTPHQWASLCIS